MEPFNPSRRVIRFAVFEVDLSAGELRKNGRKLKLQEQPFQVLASLLDRPGEVVTREELRERLWPGDTYVDFDRSLNSAVNRLREALDDSANQPRFVETLPRRGYRFVAPLERHDRVGDLSSPIPHAAETVKTPTGQTLQARLRRARLQQVVLLAAFVGAIGVIVALWLREPTAVVDAPFRRFGLPVRSARPFPVAPEISPDARHVVYTDILGSGRSLWIQDLGRTEPRELAGTDDAYRPFWSPDGGFIGFAAGLELKKIPVDGGAPISLCRIPSANFFLGGGTWSPDGRSIVFSSGEPFRLYEVPAGGGTPSLLFEPEDSEESLSFLLPHFLPLPGEERALLFTRGLGQDSEVAVRNLDTQSQETLAEGTNAAYSPTGHLVYQRRSALWAMPFSLKTLKPTGQAFQTSSANGYNPSVARDGTLVYLEHTGGGQIWLAWRDRTGKKLREVGQPQPNMAQVSLSPDGTTAAVSGEDFGWDVWLQDIGRNIKTRLTFDPALTEGVPVWSPRGDRIAFLSGTPDTSYDIMVKAADGSGESEVLVATDQEELPTDWSLDGRYFIFERTQSYVSESSSAPGDLWYLEFEGEGSGYQEFPFMKTAFDESLGKLSPDSRFIAYCSDESGRREIYVQPFPKGGAKSRISRNGGTQPRWSRDGKELFYVEDDTLIAVAVKTTPSFSVGSSTRLFKDASLKWNFLGHVYDVSSDGRQFVLRERLETSTLVIRVVQNWFEEFRDRQSEAQ